MPLYILICGLVVIDKRKMLQFTGWRDTKSTRNGSIIPQIYNKAHCARACVCVVCVTSPSQAALLQVRSHIYCSWCLPPIIPKQTKHKVKKYIRSAVVSPNGSGSCVVRLSRRHSQMCIWVGRLSYGLLVWNAWWCCIICICRLWGKECSMLVMCCGRQYVYIYIYIYVREPRAH